MLKLRNSGEDLGSVEGSFPVFFQFFFPAGLPHGLVPGWPSCIWDAVQGRTKLTGFAFCFVGNMGGYPSGFSHFLGTSLSLHHLAFWRRMMWIWDQFQNCPFGLLYLCADRREVNISLGKYAMKRNPDHVAAPWQQHCGVGAPGAASSACSMGTGPQPPLFTTANWAAARTTRPPLMMKRNNSKIKDA